MAHTNQLELYFGGGSSPGLYRTVFRPTTYPHPIVGIRGPLLQQQSLPFIWCTSCIALSILFVAAATEEAKGQLPLLPLLEGDQSSPAGAIGKCKAQMRIISFIQDEHSIKDIMKAQGIPDFQAPPPIPKFIDAVEAIDELPSYDSFEPSPDDF